MNELTPEEEEENNRYLHAVEHPVELDPEAETYPELFVREQLGKGSEDEKFCSPFGTIWTRRQAREYFERRDRRRPTIQELGGLVPDHMLWELPNDGLAFDDPPEGMDPATWQQQLLERVEQFPPLAEADLENGPDDEKFNAGNGMVVTRGMVRRDRERSARRERMEKALHGMDEIDYWPTVRSDPGSAS
jgi:hypothetical protein